MKLILAPNPVFKQKSAPVETVDDALRGQMDEMLTILYQEHGIGMAAPMVGILQRIVVIDMQEGGRKNPRFLVNPELVSASEETQVIEEASLCFPGIAADVTRPRSVTVKFLDYNGNLSELTAENLLASVIQHEMDYLDGITYLDKLSPLKRKMLIKKMEKFRKHYVPHVHTAACRH